MDKNIADVNAWITKKMSVFEPNKERNEKLLIRIPRRVPLGSEIARRSDRQQEENTCKNKDAMDQYKLRAKHLRDEFNALYQDLVTFRREKSEFYANFTKQNIDSLVELICEIHRAEDDISALEREIGLSIGGGNCGKDFQKIGKKAGTKDGFPLKMDTVRPLPEGISVRSPHEKAQEVLKTLKEITGKLKEQLASVHICVSALNQEESRERHGDQPHNNVATVKRDQMTRYECLLKDLGIKLH